MALQSLDIKRVSATTTPSPGVREPATGTVAKLIDVTKCIGCKACQTACMEWNELRDEIGFNTGVYDNPHDLTEHSWTVMRFSERENPDGNLEWLIRKDGCMHCEDPGCLKACPSPGAIVQYTNGIVDLKERGFQNAGLYDPPGVSGTHVMYVLHHADQPSLYHGLPENPRISPMVRLWKGAAKPIALGIMALTALAGFFHYTRVGPNEVTDEDEAAARDEARRMRGESPEERSDEIR
ncbi:MAG: 4Fe-4S dicluster domain-containing protein [Paraburkholderia sp.]|nr:4Fe-4S dicluster domain-containing protein [Paraburkholderia sp.]